MIKSFGQLLKFKLSITVVFSAMIGYLLGFESFILEHFLYLSFGGFLVTGSANTFNQVLEIKQDKLMQRTAVRPLPIGNLTIFQALIFAFIIGIIGLFLLNKINPQGTFYGVMSKSSFFTFLTSRTFFKAFSLASIQLFKSVGWFTIKGAIPSPVEFPIPKFLEISLSNSIKFFGFL